MIAIDVKLSQSESARLFARLRTLVVVYYCVFACAEVIIPEVQCSQNNRETASRFVSGFALLISLITLLFFAAHIYRTVVALDKQFKRPETLVSKLACMRVCVFCCLCFMFRVVVVVQSSGSKCCTAL